MIAASTLRDLGKRVYPLVPTVAQTALVSGYFYYKNRRLYGRVFRERVAALAASERLDRRALADLQSRALRRIMAAAAHAPYYRALFARCGIDVDAIRCADDLAALPMLEKEAVRQAPADFVDARHAGRGLQVVHSSGTSGTPIRLFTTPELESIEEAFIARQWSWAGFRNGDRRVRLRGDLVVPADVSSPAPWRVNYANRELRMSSYHLSSDTAAAYIDRINAFAPRALIAYPSSATILAALVRERGLRCPIPLVFTSSETLSPSQRQLIERSLEARIYDHYGSTESVVAIQECEAGSYHVIPEYGICELHPIGHDSSGPLCEIVATGLINEAMPLIRYRTGDYARPAPEGPCACGREFPRVQEIVGRQDDLVHADSGALVGRLDHVFKGLSGIIEGQIIQRGDRSIRVRLVPGSDYNDAIEDSLKRNLRSRVGNLDVEIETVAAIARGPNGKFRSVVSEITAPIGES